MPDYAVGLGGCYCNIGNLMRERGEAAASLDWFAKGLATLRPALVLGGPFYVWAAARAETPPPRRTPA